MFVPQVPEAQERVLQAVLVTVAALTVSNAVGVVLGCAWSRYACATYRVPYTTSTKPSWLQMAAIPGEIFEK